MLEIKSREDFGTEIIKSNRLFVVYGAGDYGKRFLKLNIPHKVDFFCDKNARNIKLLDSSEGKIKVLSLDELKTIKHSLDVLICIQPAKEYKYTYEQLKPIYDLLEELKVDVRVYTFFDNKSCLTKIGEKFYIIDKDQFLANNPEHFRYVFNDLDYYSDEYIEQLSQQPFNMHIVNKNKVELMEYRSKFVNHINGKRRTLRNEENHQQKIYILGDSRTSGFMSEDKFTYCSLLQKLIDENNMSYCVENHGIPGREIERMLFQIQNMNLESGDIVFLTSGCYEYEEDVLLNQEVYIRFLIEAKQYCNNKNCEFIYINLPVIHEIREKSQIENQLISICTTVKFKEYNYEVINKTKQYLLYRCMQNSVISYDFAIPFQRPHSYGEIFVDLHHYGPRGNRLVADEIFKILITLLETKQDLSDIAEEKKEQKKKTFKKNIELILENDECIKYLETIVKKYNADRYTNSGAIIMNCNPFTKGHRYLIEEAAKQVERLYIFILEEDKSEFSFEERFNLVVQNTKDIKDLVVLPSGKYIISSMTFPEYFKKNNIQDKKIDVTQDLLIFARDIAPNLNITKRFVGCEPFCKITNQYNMQMKDILPQYGIQVVEIERYETDGDAISASKVRKLIKEKNMNELKKYVTDVTYKYIIENKI